MSDAWNYAIGAVFMATILWFMVTALLRIQHEIGITSSWGWFWTFVVVLGNLFGILLFYRFREQTEFFVSTLFERH